MSSAAVLSTPLDSASDQAGSWWIDAVIAGLLLIVLAGLRPAMPDGDGLSYAAEALKPALLDGAEPKHLLYAPILRIILRGLDAAGGHDFALAAFTAFSNLCGALLYLVLARGLYPPFLRSRDLSRLCALGTLCSFGALAACCTIETYSLALLLDVILATLCLRADLTTPKGGIAAGLVFALAVGVHITNVLLGPFLLVVLAAQARRRGSWRSAGWFVAAGLLGGCLLALLVMVGKDVWPWSPDWRRLLPQGDPHPPMSLADRLGRVVYGLMRTLAWLPPVREVTPGFAVGYALSLLAAGLLVLAVARRGLVGRWRDYRWLVVLLAVFAIPFAGMGAMYYPSDSERWLFLLPAVWLVIGLAWAEHSPPANALLSRPRAVALLLLAVAALAAYNAGGKLWPESRDTPEREGLQFLAETTTAGDVVIASAPLDSPVTALVLGRRLPCRVIDLDSLMRSHGADVEACRADLRNRITNALASGRRVLAYGLLHEGLTAGRGYPWAHVLHLGYTPDRFLSVLDEFHPEPVTQLKGGRIGLYQLSARKVTTRGVAHFPRGTKTWNSSPERRRR
jgi:hypothetical protein